MQKDKEMLVRDSIKDSLKWTLNHHRLLELNLQSYNDEFSFNRAKYLAFEKTVSKQINELNEHKKGLSL